MTDTVPAGPTAITTSHDAGRTRWHRRECSADARDRPADEDGKGRLMHDIFSIWYNDQRVSGSRYLREDDAGAVYQTVFYHHRPRPDPTAYCGLASDDAAMNVAAGRLLAQLVDEAAQRRRPL